MSCFGVRSKAWLINWESFQQHQRTLSLFIRATICPPFFLTFVFFLCPQALFHWISGRCSPCSSCGVDLVCHGGQMSKDAMSKEWIWFVMVSRCRMSVDASGWWMWGSDRGQDEKCCGLAEGPGLERLMRGEKGKEKSFNLQGECRSHFPVWRAVRFSSCLWKLNVIKLPPWNNKNKGLKPEIWGKSYWNKIIL